MVSIILKLFIFAESAILSREQVEAPWHDGAVLWQWIHLPVYRCQASDPEEMKLLSVAHCK